MALERLLMGYFWLLYWFAGQKCEIEKRAVTCFAGGFGWQRGFVSFSEFPLDFSILGDFGNWGDFLANLENFGNFDSHIKISSLGREFSRTEIFQQHLY